LAKHARDELQVVHDLRLGWRFRRAEILPVAELAHHPAKTKMPMIDF